MNATAADDGYYKCILGSTDDKNPREHTGFNLRVYKKTSFGNTPSQVVLPVDKQGALTCHVEFDPKVISVEVGWLRGGKPIDMFNDSSYKVLDYDQAKQVSQLLISPVKRNHEGEYTCSASAQTTDLSKIYEHNIYLEAHYAPVFDSSLQTVWVERSSSLAGQPKQPAASANQQPMSPHGRTRSRHGKPHYPTQLGHVNTYPDPTGEPSANASSQSPAGSAGSSSVRVELRCTCQANPAASIVWTQSSANFVLEKGVSPQVLDGPKTEVDGHTTTSVLIINYSFEPDYQFKRENYICSASNMLGNAAKTFKIEQGDPPPAFQVGPISHDSSRGSKLGFSLIGPIFEPDVQHPARTMADVVPPIDMLRIRVDNDEANRLASAGSKARNNILSISNFNAITQAVEWQVGQAGSSNPESLSLPRNFTIDISRLPKGKQRLFLEAHNSVGWSPNGTYLGDFYIVNGAVHLSQHPVLPLLFALLVLVFSARRNPSTSIISLG